MVAFYVYKIENNIMAVEEVPPYWRAKVQAVLDSKVAQ